MNVQCPECKGKGSVHFMQSPTAPEVLCNRCGGKKVIEYRDTVLTRGKLKLVACGCYGGAVDATSGDVCPKCLGEGATRVADDGA